MVKEIEIIVRLVIELSGQKITVGVQSETVITQPEGKPTPMLLDGGEWFTAQCPFCGWIMSYEKQSNAKRGLSAHARQLHHMEWQRGFAKTNSRVSAR